MHEYYKSSGARETMAYKWSDGYYRTHPEHPPGKPRRKHTLKRLLHSAGTTLLLVISAAAIRELADSIDPEAMLGVITAGTFFIVYAIINKPPDPGQ
jgi:hypothetical protein